MYSTRADDHAGHGRVDSRGAARQGQLGRGPCFAGAAGSPVDRAMPKSMISAVPSACSMMLAGLRSRWTTPTAWAAASPDATERAICSTFGVASRPSARTAVVRSVPSTYEHRDVLDAVDLPDVVNADDVLVGDLAREQQLPLEAPLDVGGDRRVGHRLGTNHLDRHRDAELGIPRLIDGAHPAGPKQPDDVIARPERLSRFERRAPALAFRPGLDRRRRVRTNAGHRPGAGQCSGEACDGALVLTHGGGVEDDGGHKISQRCSTNRALARAGRSGRPALRAIHGGNDRKPIISLHSSRAAANSRSRARPTSAVQGGAPEGGLYS